jgi:hypothetical protein
VIGAIVIGVADATAAAAMIADPDAIEATVTADLAVKGVAIGAATAARAVTAKAASVRAETTAPRPSSRPRS